MVRHSGAVIACVKHRQIKTIFDIDYLRRSSHIHGYDKTYYGQLVILYIINDSPNINIKDPL